MKNLEIKTDIILHYKSIISHDEISKLVAMVKSTSYSKIADWR